jgi:UDP-N-acetyl-2-amino-2-deoxyglucuronate dehydrogenase
MKKWNFGIVGAGVIAGFHARAIGDLPNAKLAGVCDPVREKAAALADKFGCRVFKDYDEMARSGEVDVLTIATPSGLHLGPVVAAAENKKHVVCEKPLEITLERIDRMIAAHKKAGTLLGGIFQNRFKDAMQPLRQAAAEQRFGKITSAVVCVPWWRTDAYYTNTWHGTWKLDGGGALMNQAIHTIDMLCDLMPPVESVMGFADHVGHPQIETEDTAVAALRFTTGAMGLIYGTTASWPGRFMRFEITGTAGTAVYEEDSLTVWKFLNEKPEDKDIIARFGTVKGTGGGSDPAAINYENHTRNFRAFLDALDKGADFEITGAEARKSVQLILAIYKSAQEKRLVKLSELK